MRRERKFCTIRIYNEKSLPARVKYTGAVPNADVLNADFLNAGKIQRATNAP